MNTPLTLLNQLTAEQFLAEYWQKKPLLIKQAIPDFKGLLTPDELAGLACEDDVQSRIVAFKKGKWSAKHGPFGEGDFAKLPEKTTPENNWTLLVQSVNYFLPEADALLRQFDFIPHARLDDLMVSYAPNGGGVGPHFDSYDVFLLQGQGKRLWRISAQTDLTLVEGAPLRILKRFDTAQEWLLEAGDMLYLPPHLAHWGIAVSDGEQDCMTYSIGFRAPKNQELATEFLGFLQDKLNQDVLTIDGIYQDPDLTLQAHPAEISSAMIQTVSENLIKLQWDRLIKDEALIGEFLGTYLSEPKNHVVFEKNKKIPLAKFTEKMYQQGLTLDFKSQMLFVKESFYLNGEAFACANASASLLKTLADKRECAPKSLSDDASIAQLYAWYLAGFIHLKSA